MFGSEILFLNVIYETYQERLLKFRKPCRGDIYRTLDRAEGKEARGIAVSKGTSLARLNLYTN